MARTNYSTDTQSTSTMPPALPAEQKHIFVSSTVKNFRYLRQILATFIEKAGHIPYGNELPEFPVQGIGHPMDECLHVVQERATHFILLLGERWGLPYYRDATRSATEVEYLAARDKRLPVICFVELETWKEAQVFHGSKSAEGMRTDSRVLEFIDQHIMHGDVAWVSAFSHYQEILEKLRESWLVSETIECPLLILEEEGGNYYTHIDEYADAFYNFLNHDGPLPVPRMYIPKKDMDYIEVHSAHAHTHNDSLRLGAFDKWRASFARIGTDVNLALKIAADVYRLRETFGKAPPKGPLTSECGSRSTFVSTPAPATVRSDSYKEELTNTLRTALRYFLVFSRMDVYSLQKGGTLPRLIGTEMSIPCQHVNNNIHRILGCKDTEVLTLKYYRGYVHEMLWAKVSVPMFEKWQRALRRPTICSYAEFLHEWATIVVPQTITFADDINTELLSALLFQIDNLEGSGYENSSDLERYYLTGTELRGHATQQAG
jgi:hypothetical protein